MVVTSSLNLDKLTPLLSTSEPFDFFSSAQLFSYNEFHKTSGCSQVPALNPLPGAEVSETRFLMKEMKTTCGVSARPFLDRVRFFTLLRTMVNHVTRKAFFNSRAALSVFYTLMDFAISYIRASKGARLRHYISYPRYRLFQYRQPQFQEPILERLYSIYLAKKDRAFAMNRDLLQMLLLVYSAEQIASSQRLTRKVLFKLSCMDDVLCWSNCTTLYGDEGQFDWTYNLEPKADFYRVTEQLAPYALSFDPKLHYLVENCFTITLTAESIKAIFLPSYNTSPFLELVDDFLAFGNLLRTHRGIFEDSVQKEIDFLRDQYYILLDFFQSIISDLFPLLESGRTYILPVEKYDAYNRKWFQVAGPESPLLDGNKWMLPYRKGLLMYYHVAFQLYLHIFPQFRFFLTTKNMGMDFMSASWLQVEDFAEFMGKTQNSRFGFLDADVGLLIFHAFQYHMVYLQRVFAFFRVRRLSILRYVKLNGTESSAALSDGLSSLTKQKVLKNINETQVKYFKTTVLLPEHYVHEGDLVGKPLQFVRPAKEQDSFYVQDYDKVVRNYMAFGWDQKLDSAIAACCGFPGLDPRVGEDLKNQIKYAFNILAFAQHVPNFPAYVNSHTGLFRFDFDPFENVPFNSQWSVNVDNILMGTILQFFEILQSFADEQAADSQTAGRPTFNERSGSTVLLPSYLDDTVVARPQPLHPLDTSYLGSPHSLSSTVNLMSASPGLNMSNFPTPARGRENSIGPSPQSQIASPNVGGIPFYMDTSRTANKRVPLYPGNSEYNGMNSIGSMSNMGSVESTPGVNLGLSGIDMSYVNIMEMGNMATPSFGGNALVDGSLSSSNMESFNTNIEQQDVFCDNSNRTTVFGFDELDFGSFLAPVSEIEPYRGPQEWNREDADLACQKAFERFEKSQDL